MQEIIREAREALEKEDYAKVERLARTVLEVKGQEHAEAQFLLGAGIAGNSTVDEPRIEEAFKGWTISALIARSIGQEELKGEVLNYISKFSLLCAFSIKRIVCNDLGRGSDVFETVFEKLTHCLKVFEEESGVILADEAIVNSFIDVVFEGVQQAWAPYQEKIEVNRSLVLEEYAETANHFVPCSMLLNKMLMKVSDEEKGQKIVAMFRRAYDFMSRLTMYGEVASRRVPLDLTEQKEAYKEFGAYLERYEYMYDRLAQEHLIEMVLKKSSDKRAAEEERLGTEQYWKEHPEEREELEGKIKSAANEIIDLRKQVCQPKSEQLYQELGQQLAKTELELSALGFFQMKEKKRLRAEMERLTKERNDASNAIEQEKKDFKNKINAEVAKVQQKRDGLQKQLNEVKGRVEIPRATLPGVVTNGRYNVTVKEIVAHLATLLPKQYTLEQEEEGKFAVGDKYTAPLAWSLKENDKAAGVTYNFYASSENDYPTAIAITALGWEIKNGGKLFMGYMAEQGGYLINALVPGLTTKEAERFACDAFLKPGQTPSTQGELYFTKVECEIDYVLITFNHHGLLIRPFGELSEKEQTLVLLSKKQEEK